MKLPQRKLPQLLAREENILMRDGMPMESDLYAELQEPGEAQLYTTHDDNRDDERRSHHSSSVYD